MKQLVGMEPPRKHKSSGVSVKEEVESEDGNVQVGKNMSVKEEVESEDGNDLLVKRRRTEISGPIVQLQQKIEVFDMENKAPNGLPVEDPTGKDPMDMPTSCEVQNSGQANGCSNESASSKLLKICKVIGSKEPSYDFEEQGPPHVRIFKCKVTVHLHGPVNTIVECFSDPKPRKKAAQENAAEGALWCLQR